jgi:hypothetical protein
MGQQHAALMPPLDAGSVPAGDTPPSLAVLAFSLLSRAGEPVAHRVPASDAAESALLLALRAFAGNGVDAEGRLGGLLAQAELLVAMRSRRSRADAPDAVRDCSLVLVTTTAGERILPLFTSSASLRRFVRDELTAGTPMAPAKALEVALSMGFDAIEIDRGSDCACRLARHQVAQLHQIALAHTAV